MRGRRRSTWSGAGLAALLAIGSVSLITAAGSVRADDVPPEVIASGTVDFPGGTFHWRSFPTDLAAVGAPSQAPLPFSIIYVTSGTVTVDDGAPFALPTGQAQMFERGPSPVLTGRGGASFRTLQIYNEADSEPVHATGDAFTVPRALHDAELLRVDLDAGEQTAVPASGLPILVQVIEGDVTVTAGAGAGGDDVPLGPGESDTFDGPLTIGAADGPATVLAVVLTGPESTTAAPAAPPAAPPLAPPEPTRPETLTLTIIVDAPLTARPGDSVPVDVTVLPTGYEGVETELIVSASPPLDDDSGQVACYFEDRRDLALPPDRPVTIELSITMDDVGVCEIRATSGAQFVIGRSDAVTIDVSGAG